MSAYLVAEVDWRDPEIQKEYRAKLGPTLEKYGGRTVAAGPPRLLEGDWKPPRVVVIEFPTMDSLLRWYASEEYAPLIRLRQRGARTSIVAVESALG